MLPVQNLGTALRSGRVVEARWMLAVLLPFCAASQAGRAAESVEFARDIRPLFNKHCTSCHGGLKQRLTTVTKPAKAVKEILA